MTARDWLDAHAAEVGGALAGLTAQADRVDRWAGVLAALLPAGGRVLTAGNGGSAAEAQHLAAELVGRFHDDRPAYSAVALTAETATLTALLNDYGADEVFARQVDAHGRPGDVLVLLSTSGRSPNVLRAAERGHARGLTVWALTGPAPNPLADAADEALCLDAASTAGVQAGHLVAVHALCAAFDAVLGVGAAPATGRPPEPGGGPRVVVVGDLLLDRDVDGGTDRLCPDSAAPVLDVATVRERPGGAGLAALLCAASGAEVTLVAPVADDAAGRRLRELLAPAVALVALPHVGPTRTKTRVRSHGQTLVRLDDGGPGRPGSGVPADAVRAALAGADAALVSDYGAGTVRDAGVRGALAEALRTTRTVWDPHPRGGPPLPGATLVTPNAAEARAALGAEAGTPPDALAAALLDAWDARGAAVTAGEQGAYLAAAADVAFLPAPPAVDGDACGAGDRFAATATVALARGSGLPEAVGAAVAEAAAWVAAGGVAGVLAAPDPDPHGPGPQPDGRAAASSDGHPDPVAALAARLRARGGPLVATGGCFDLVHTGHVATLEAARRLGGALVVLLNSDASVRRLKGPDRPVVGAADRARVLAALACVDAVLVFDEDDPRALLDRLRPDVWVKGADHDGAPLPEAAVVERHGGRVLLLPYLDGRSTTSLIQRTGRSRART